MKPTTLAEYKGQELAKAVLLPAVQAAKLGKKLDHILLHGPAGTGKSTLAELIAKEMGTNCTVIDARNIKSVQDFIDLTLNLQDNDILFIDEIHGLDSELEELFYEALEQYQIRMKLGNQVAVLPLHRFVVIGATTLPAKLTTPMRTRLKIHAELEFYTVEQLSEMAIFMSKKIGRTMDKEGAVLLAKAARGVARNLVGLIGRADDLCMLYGVTHITKLMVESALKNVGIDRYGLNNQDRKLIRAIRDIYQNQPTGIKALAATLGDSEDTIEQVVEPHLLRQGFILRTPRGRVLSTRGLEVQV